jgi:hypothetical protein
MTSHVLHHTHPSTLAFRFHRLRYQHTLFVRRIIISYPTSLPKLITPTTPPSESLQDFSHHFPPHHFRALRRLLEGEKESQKSHAISLRITSVIELSFEPFLLFLHFVFSFLLDPIQSKAYNICTVPPLAPSASSSYLFPFPKFHCSRALNFLTCARLFVFDGSFSCGRREKKEDGRRR